GVSDVSSVSDRSDRSGVSDRPDVSVHPESSDVPRHPDPAGGPAASGALGMPVVARRAMLIDAPGFRCNVIDEGAGEPVVWLHGLGGTWRDFAPQLDRWPEHVRCIVPEMRGHGRTPPTDGPMSTRTLAADVQAVLGALGVSHATVVGLSLGGMVAQVLAVDCPALVDRLVLVDTRQKVSRAVGVLLRVAARQVSSRGVPAALAMLDRIARMAGQPWGAEAMRRARANGVAWQQRDLASNDADVLARAMLALVDHDEHVPLARIDVPTLVVVGEDDPVVPPRAAAELAAAISGARLVVVPGAGHLPNRDRPEIFDGHLAAFLGVPLP
ncbi:MAG: alpha/beta fold hydrolase, partial [Actinomycetota bacterium]|nr:alpha/beta fold hydrolase [Actinomycetota bacterium]